MKRALLISVHPEWAEKILNGEKTIEIRKSMPKCELPIDVYLYCTKGKSLLRLPTGNKEWFIDVPFGWVVDKKSNFNGKVVAKFTLNKVEEIDNWYHLDKNNFAKTCLTISELVNYIGNFDIGYAWHIDKLEIFDKPKELSEFIHYRRETIYCGMDCPPYTDWVEYPVRKAPQKCMWVYGGEQS